MAARDRGAPPQALFKRKRARVAPAAIGEILTRTSYFGRPPIRGCGAAEMHEIRPKHRQIFPRRVTNRARARNVGEGGGALEGGIFDDAWDGSHASQQHHRPVYPTWCKLH